MSAPNINWYTSNMGTGSGFFKEWISNLVKDNWNFMDTLFLERQYESWTVGFKTMFLAWLTVFTSTKIWLHFIGFSSVQLLSRIQLFVTPWTAARQASLSITTYLRLLKLYLLSQLCHPTISSSVTCISSCPQSFPASGSFQMSQFFTSGGQSIGVSSSASVLPMNIQDWFPLGLTGWISLQSKGLSRVFSTTSVQKYQFFSAQLSSQSNCHIQSWLLEKPHLWLDRLLLAK